MTPHELNEAILSLPQRHPVPADVPPGPAFDAWRLAALSPSAFAALRPAAQVAYLAALGLLAPTTHNTVPQRFLASKGQLHLGLDRSRVLPASDPTGRQATISAGCALENVVAGARSLGVGASVEVESPLNVGPNKAAGSPVGLARIRFHPGSGASAGSTPGTIEAMLTRKMVRAEFDGRVPLAEELVETLREVVAAIDSGLALHVITDAPTRFALSKFQEMADATVINAAPFALELAQWIVANDSGRTVGMRGREFGLDDTATVHFQRGLSGGERLLADEAAGFAKIGGAGIRSAPAVFVITAERDDIPNWLSAGRAFQAVALSLLLAGFAVSMHAGITEVDAPNFAVRARLRTRFRPVVMFRAGRPLKNADGQRAHASRPPLREILYPCAESPEPGLHTSVSSAISGGAPTRMAGPQ